MLLSSRPTHRGYTIHNMEDLLPLYNHAVADLFMLFNCSVKPGEILKIPLGYGVEKRAVYIVIACVYGLTGRKLHYNTMPALQKYEFNSIFLNGENLN